MKPRILPLFIILIISFLILWVRLFYLQIIEGKHNSELAHGNRIKIISIPAQRGVIYDRHNRVLVRNRPEGREYIYGQSLAHVLGYVGEVSPEDIENDPAKMRGDQTGKIGLEQQYDQGLRGKNGGILVETDAVGATIREVKRQEPEDGQSLNISLDLDLQLKGFELLQGRRGAVVVSNPKTGEILALVSSPSFAPNIFIEPKKHGKEITAVFSNTEKPLFNRAIGGLYPPGSTFKLVVGIAGLEENKISESSQFEDTGEIKVGGSSFGNWYFRQYGKTEGQVNITKALQRSNDIFFYKTGEEVGIAKIVSWAKYFGLGDRLGIDLPGEVKGLIPSPEWKKQQKLEHWYLGDTYITSIGQGDLELTPLQVNHITSAVASGLLCQPHFVSLGKNYCQKLNIKPGTLAIIKEGMKEACSEGGTGWPFFDFKPQVACKTGTAEIGDALGRTHAWFTAFAPQDNPEISVTVVIEGSGEGSSVAGPVAKEILGLWFKNK